MKMKPLLTATLLIAAIAYAQGGTIVAWGWNSYGQIDVPPPNQDFVSVFAGGST